MCIRDRLTAVIGGLTPCGMLPLAAKKLGADPAIMATPFITPIVDACSLILYFQIAPLVFRNMM